MQGPGRGSRWFSGQPECTRGDLHGCRHEGRHVCHFRRFHSPGCRCLLRGRMGITEQGTWVARSAIPGHESHASPKLLSPMLSFPTLFLPTLPVPTFPSRLGRHSGTPAGRHCIIPTASHAVDLVGSQTVYVDGSMVLMEKSMNGSRGRSCKVWAMIPPPGYPFSLREGKHCCCQGQRRTQLMQGGMKSPFPWLKDDGKRTRHDLDVEQGDSHAVCSRRSGAEHVQLVLVPDWDEEWMLGSCKDDPLFS